MPAAHPTNRHRPSAARTPADRRPWHWAQHWRDLLFAHWRVPADRLGPHLPAGLAVDPRDGSAWVSAVAFTLARARFQGLPAVPYFSKFSELNLRTYVRCGRRRGVYFLSIHAGRWLSAAVARRLTPLPYDSAPVRYRCRDGAYRFRCGGRFAAAFVPGPGYPRLASADPLDGWLLERYRAFAADPGGTLHSARVHHARWAVRPVTLTITVNTAGEPFGLDLRRPPDRAHFSDGVAARIEAFTPVRPLSRGSQNRVRGQHGSASRG
jgi:uncharacterized protein YqjF (DUF2071 family)